MHRPEIDREALTQTLRDMVGIDSVNPSLVEGAAGETEIADYLEDWMNALGLETRRYDVEPGRPNVVGVLRGAGGGKTLLLNGHTDTVGVEYMTIDPFDPATEDGRLYGRGSFDMKGGLAASMAAVKTIVEEGTLLRGDVILAAVCDEEYASIGTERLMMDTTADAAIVGEFTAGNIQVAHKGFAWVDVETHGVAAHGSLHRVGVDAIAKMGHVLVGLEAMGRQLEETEHPLVGPGSVHASTIGGGSELSTYPASCRLQLERRLIPGEDREGVDEEMTSLIKSLEDGDPRFKADYAITFYRGPMEISPDEEICRVLREGSRRLLGKTPRYVGGTGWMDTQIIYGKGIPAVAHGPDGYGAHAKEEWVDLESVYETAQVHWYAVKEFCGEA
jgi:acetylornithine deacetylase